jgi:sugar phosphate isomerase/epimerase
MGRFRYSYSVSGRSVEDLSAPIDRMARLGYDAVELAGELPVEEAGGIRRLLDGTGMAASSICPSFTAERDLAHPDREVRENAVRYVRGLADVANSVGPPPFSETSPSPRRKRSGSGRSRASGPAVSTRLL